MRRTRARSFSLIAWLYSAGVGSAPGSHDLKVLGRHDHGAVVGTVEVCDQRGEVGDERDVLSEMLRTVRLTGSVFLDARFSAPFGVLSTRRFDSAAAMAHLRHISMFHLIAAGACTIETAAGERRTVSAGEILLLPFADNHKFWNGTFPKLALAPSLFRPGPVAGM